jgi:hypothetical protein
MDRPCRSSWTRAHENFQVREYDAGASPMSSEPAWKRKTAGRHPAQIFEKHLEIVARTLMRKFNEAHLYIVIRPQAIRSRLK